MLSELLFPNTRLLKLRDRFKKHYSSVEKIKKEATKLQDDTRAYVKCYKNLGEELGAWIALSSALAGAFSRNMERQCFLIAFLDGVFTIAQEEHGKRYKSWAQALETASQELQVPPDRIRVYSHLF